MNKVDAILKDKQFRALSEMIKEKEFDRLAEVLRVSLDMEKIYSMLREARI